jgi:hypothetical protein
VFQVIDTYTSAIVGTYTTSRQAHRVRDRKGAVRYQVITLPLAK